MNRQDARRLAIERAINAMQGDLQIGGLGAYLEGQGYSAADVRKVEQAYQEQIARLQATLERGHNHE